jgi:transposase
MEAIVERCCGLDVHQARVVACVLRGGPAARAVKESRTFPTFTPDVLALRTWLEAEGVTQVGMESTGVYWRPVYAVLEGRFELIVGNAQHIKAVPGRKTDVRDSEWIAQLVRHGLIRKSFIPAQPLRELRDLVRYRRKLIESQTTERNRVLKLLETANIKLASVASDVFGTSGMAMLRALVTDHVPAATIAALAKGLLRKKLPALTAALTGCFEAHHRFLLQVQLERLTQLASHLAHLDTRIAALLEPYHVAYTRLQRIPGVSTVTATILIAELGTDMSVFRNAQHLASWAAICPGNNESAGKHRSGKIRPGNVLLQTALVEAAQACTRTKGTYLRDKFHRLRARRGYKRALIAIAHKILIAAYHLLAGATDYRELGETYLDRLDATRTVATLKRRLERLGYRVQLEPRAA